MSKIIIKFILAACCLLFFSSCTQGLYKNTFVILGTYLEVTSPYKKAANIVHEEFKRLDKIFNTYSSTSEISRLNGTYGVSFEVSEELIEVLKLSRDLTKMTNGAFDVTYGTLYEFWKGLTKEGRLREFPSEDKIRELKDIGGINNLEINIDKQTVLIKKQGLKIDIGGIAKGYIVDKAVRKLKQNGIDSAIINAGGDIYCLGKNKDKPWRVGIKDPKELIEVIESQDLVSEAIATSGNYEQFFEYKGERYSHLINPKTGYPIKNNILSVSVISKNCTTADSLATAFFVMGVEKIKEFFSKNPSTMKVFVVTEDNGKKHVHVFK